MYFSHVARFDDERGAGSQMLTHQTVVNSRREQKARNGRVRGRGTAIAQDDDVDAVADVRHHLVGHVLQRGGEPLRGGYLVPARERARRWRPYGTPRSRVARRCSESSRAHGRSARATAGQSDGSALRSRCRRFSSPPMTTREDVTSSSRIASRGGLVTWAKS